MTLASIEVEFAYHTGVPQPLFNNVRLCGGWDATGQPSREWTTVAMTERRGDDGCPTFHATVRFPDSLVGQELPWGVLLDGPSGRGVWGIPTEVNDAVSTASHRAFTLGRDPATQHYWLNTNRRLGANKHFDSDGRHGLRFAVWAPNARAVSVVFGDPISGYIADDGAGVVGEPVPMRRDDGGDGVWTTDPDDPRLADFAALDHQPYMFRVVCDDGRVAYRTDLYSRCQIGHGTCDPACLALGEGFSGRWQDLDGTISCSVIVDPQRVTEKFSEPTWPEVAWLSENDFWADEFDPQRPLPTRMEDLVIYELHVGGLGAGRVDGSGVPVPGDLGDAVALLDHLLLLGVNAVQFMPMAEFEGWASWGYGTSHYFAVEFSGGGRDQFKHFVRACHRRGIAVILDVVYNHYHHEAKRAEWAYDSDDPERNIYYWYEKSPDGYADPAGGYIDNYSTGWAPRLWEEQVRQMLISSAVAQALEFHVDGFRVDQTTSLHQFATLHADGRPVAAANAFGAKFLRELTRTLRLVKPAVLLIAEDHSGWPGVTHPTSLGGLGFDAIWYASFYHHLIGDTGHGADSANLLTTAARGDNRPLRMSYFAGALAASADSKVVYHESHDEAGNSAYPGGRSGRTLTVAVDRAPLVGDTRRYAEARARFACGMSMLSAGTPMFFMAEEVGATADYRYDDFVYHRTDIEAAARGEGSNLFAFYQAVITLRRSVAALRARALEILHVDDTNRVLAFRRSYGGDDVLVVASLNDRPFASGYAFGDVRDGTWREIFNSDSAWYGGWNDGNSAADLASCSGRINPVLPRAGFVVLRRL
jgi:1,4-alpha-glucan branching enzyme